MFNKFVVSTVKKHIMTNIKINNKDMSTKVNVISSHHMNP
jgi:hypothetical protein